MYYTIAHRSKNVSLWLHKWFMLSNRHITQPTCSSTDMSAEHRKSFNPNSQTLLMVFQLSLVSKEEQPRGAFLPATYRITVPACIVCGLPFVTWDIHWYLKVFSTWNGICHQHFCSSYYLWTTSRALTVHCCSNKRYSNKAAAYKLKYLNPIALGHECLLQHRATPFLSLGVFSYFRLLQNPERKTVWGSNTDPAEALKIEMSGDCQACLRVNQSLSTWLNTNTAEMVED